MGVGINMICKVSFTPTGGIAVLPEDWCSSVFISERQSCRSAMVGIGGGRGLAGLCQYIIGQLIHQGLLEGGIVPVESWNN